MQDIRFYKVVIWLNAAVPLGFMAYDAANGRLGANPLEFFLRSTGVLTLSFLLISLLVTPLRKLFGWNGLIKYRRLLGLIAFFYGCIHLVTYSIFDKSLDLSLIAADIAQRPFIAIGLTAFLILVPLAITSTNGWVKRLGGKRWAKLHRLVYLAAILGVIHFWMIVKSDIFYPAVFGLALFVLFLVRVYFARRQSGQVRPATAKN
ncbi:MAG TPA: protein-methionine-sulfoxide reductase heme-binding subunit MsrQ [Pyrinomonadaceae bacterium]|jgi:sulfoxide reductase heme-binding subunit YedZ|nr:protein-methionine-sulfoxide reductase heme-binding subunit MsrQ [Pyrinomonadaceae bacterium]